MIDKRKCKENCSSLRTWGMASVAACCWVLLLLLLLLLTLGPPEPDLLFFYSNGERRCFLQLCRYCCRQPGKGQTVCLATDFACTFVFGFCLTFCICFCLFVWFLVIRIERAKSREAEDCTLVYIPDVVLGIVRIAISTT